MSNQERESTCVVRGDRIEVRSTSRHHEGTNDYTNSRTDIETIEDREGRPLKPVWDDGWTRVADGVDTRRDGYAHIVRIAAAACPVRVRFLDFHEYVSYTDSEHCSSFVSHYWVRYVAGGDPPVA